MLPNQSLPSVQTGTEDRTVLYWTEVESGSAKAVEGIDPSVDTLHYSWPNLCWLLFVSVSSSLWGDCYLALALIFIWSAGIRARAAHTRKDLIKQEDCQSNHNTVSLLTVLSIVKLIYFQSTFKKPHTLNKVMCRTDTQITKMDFKWTYEHIKNAQSEHCISPDDQTSVHGEEHPSTAPLKLLSFIV